jgi:protocatechuate 3,4-dioxygenase, beta subunit
MECEEPMTADQCTCTRREFLNFGIVAGVAAVCVPEAWAQAETPTTPSTILGPFYPVIRPLEWDANLTRIRGHRSRAEGQVIHVAGRVLNQRREPLREARVELWQANTFGRYNHPSDPNPASLDPNFQGYGVQVTDREGRFRFTTIKPGPYPFEAGMRAPHLHFQVTGRTERRVTQLFFAGEPLNVQDFVLQGVPHHRDKLIADLLSPPPDEDPATRLIHWDMVLRRG